ncbi:two component transcriptional regulator, LuxR family [Nocardioides terrae]|uniref:Two component transcriptional regulator, LuxR family n=1 Tax=Nocardioides terrae TaxID=574651 RepID=A0A1I1HUR3_9ACTN|nr:response regulator transcription factor [Nocardioides terrae]SFC27664.1 two component transcriptional regulator, LuxR family [Nocardioides terrae]
MTMTMPVTQPPSTRAKLRILIVEDHMLFAESLELVLSVEGYDVRRIAVPDNSGSPGALLSSVVRLRPRIVLLDLDLGGFGDGVRLIAPLAKAGINVVVVTASADRGRWGEAIRYGARTVLSKAQPLSGILATVRRINEGLPVLTHEEREDLLRTWHQQRSQLQELMGRLSMLTARESQVLGRLMQGRTVHDIAALSVVSEATVRTQVKAILAKLEVSSQLAAVGLAHQVGWRPPAL